MSARELTPNELAKLLAVAGNSTNGSRNQLALLMTHWSGLRVGEVCCVKVKDVEGKDRLHIKPSYTKGNKGRDVLLSSKLQMMISDHLATRNAAPDEALIKSSRGNHFHPAGLTNLLCRLYKEAGIAGGSSHSGRKTFITSCMDSGAGLRDVQVQVGHSYLSTTQQYFKSREAARRHMVENV